MGIIKMGNSFFTRNTKRFIIAILTILISGLKFITNMLTLGISFLTKKELPMVDDWATHRDDDERQESIKRSIYVVEHNKNTFNENSHEWSEWNPKIKRP
jgi:hypothetical protein